MKISQIPPDLRVLWLAAPDGAPRPAPLRAGEPGYPVSADLLPGRPPGTRLETAVADLASLLVEEDPFAAAVALVAVLALWDEEFRAAGLFRGNVYLATEESVPGLLDAANLALPGLRSPRERDSLLTEIFQLELIYRFPVAVKFRGEFGPDRQFRLNCWGRRLAERLQEQPAGRSFFDGARAAIRHHLRAHDSAYRRHMALLADLAARPPGAGWRSAQDLPVPVLV